MVDSHYVFFRHNDALYPGRVVNCVQVPFAEIRGYGDDSISERELRSQLLHGSQYASRASADEQVMILTKEKTSRNGSLFAHLYTSSGLARSASFGLTLVPMPGMFRFRRASERDRAGRLDGYNRDLLNS